MYPMAVRTKVTRDISIADFWRLTGKPAELLSQVALCGLHGFPTHWVVRQNPAGRGLSAWGLPQQPTPLNPPHSLDLLTVQPIPTSLHPNSQTLKQNKTHETNWSKRQLTGTPGIPRGPSFPVSPGGPLGPGGPGGPGGPACPWSPCNGEEDQPWLKDRDSVFFSTL